MQSLGDRIGPSVGLDPLAAPRATGRFRLLAEPLRIPAPFPDASFDAIVMLATLEHIVAKEPLAAECWRLLRAGGRLIITVPARAVDRIVSLLCLLRLADGMSLDEHHGYDPRSTPDIFGRFGFVLERWRRFQLGLNHLFVLTKPLAISDGQGATAPDVACASTPVLA